MVEMGVLVTISGDKMRPGLAALRLGHSAIAGLGIGGIAIALATQNILSDLFASLSIVLDKPFVLGDFVAVDEHKGNIEHIGLKTTRIRSLSGEHPNWDEYRRAMSEQGKCLIGIEATRWGPIASGGFPESMFEPEP